MALTAPNPSPAGPLPQRPGLGLSAMLRAAWHDYAVALHAEDAAFELPETQQALDRPDGRMPAVYVAAAAQAEAAFARYLLLAQEHARGGE